MIYWGIECTKGRFKGLLINDYGTPGGPPLLFTKRKDAVADIKKNYADAEANGERPVKVKVERVEE